jgi:hypothetical protein
MHKVAYCLVALLACSAMQATAARSLSTFGHLLGHGSNAPCSNSASPVAPLSSGSKWRAEMSGDKNIKPNTTGGPACMFVAALVVYCGCLLCIMLRS